MTVDTLRQIAEDTYLLAAAIREGDDSYLIDWDFPEGSDARTREAHREWRIIELVVSIGDRLVTTAGLNPDETWTPVSIRDMVNT